MLLRRDRGLGYLLEAFLHIFLPRTCLCCGRTLATAETDVCIVCLSELAQTGFERMPTNPMLTSMEGRVRLTAAAGIFYFRHDSPIRDIIHEFKYHANPGIAVRMGRIMGRHLRDAHFADQFDCLVPVPLHPRKKRIRGYNQSEMLARGVSEVTGLPVRTDILVRSVFRESQTRMGTGQRFENVKDCFEATSRADGDTRLRILLVDDVFTTGSTSEACASPLHKAGFASVGVATLAYVLH